MDHNIHHIFPISTAIAIKSFHLNVVLLSNHLQDRLMCAYKSFFSHIWNTSGVYIQAHLSEDFVVTIVGHKGTKLLGKFFIQNLSLSKISSNYKMLANN